MDQLAIVKRRLRGQRLTGQRFGSAAEAVGWHLAVQAQEFAEAKWSLSERTGNLTDGDLEDAFSRGEILRTHVLRPTWHFVTPEDIGWLLELTAPRVRAAIAFYDRQLGVDEALLRRSSAVIAAALGPGEPLLRKEIGAALAAAGIEAESQRLGHILMHAELDGLICSGPRRGKSHTYMLLAERAPGTRRLPREEALAEMALRYFESHGPATAKDCSWWSGLAVSDVRAGVAANAETLTCRTDESGTEWYSVPGPGPRSAHRGAFLVPQFDELVVAYKDLRQVHAGEAPERSLTSRPIVIGGITAGDWKRTIAGDSVTVEARLATRLEPKDRRALDAAVVRFGRFLGLPATLRTERTAG